MNRRLFNKIKEYFKMLWFKNIIEIMDIDYEEMKIQYYWKTEGFDNPDAEVFVKDEKIYSGLVDEYCNLFVCESFETLKKAIEETFQDEDWEKYNK